MTRLTDCASFTSRSSCISFGRSGSLPKERAAAFKRRICNVQDSLYRQQLQGELQALYSAWLLAIFWTGLTYWSSTQQLSGLSFWRFLQPCSSSSFYCASLSAMSDPFARPSSRNSSSRRYSFDPSMPPLPPLRPSYSSFSGSSLRLPPISSLSLDTPYDVEGPVKLSPLTMPLPTPGSMRRQPSG